jgi:putative chitinase
MSDSGHRAITTSGQNSSTTDVGVGGAATGSPTRATAPYDFLAQSQATKQSLDTYSPYVDFPYTVEWTARCMITSDRLTALSGYIPADRAKAYAPLLDRARGDGDIRMPARVGNWIAQIVEETGYLKSLVESFVYSTAEGLYNTFKRGNVHSVEQAQSILLEAKKSGTYNQEYVANIVYANINGNGGVASGDGYRYRGRGFLQLTGRGNYKMLGAITKLDLEGTPDLAADPPTAAKIAALYWQSTNCNVYADKENVRAITQAINGGGLNGLDLRTSLAMKAAAIWK